eukprot:281463-Pelagomonas_calceolata.AAC.4
MTILTKKHAQILHRSMLVAQGSEHPPLLRALSPSCSMPREKEPGECPPLTCLPSSGIQGLRGADQLGFDQGHGGMQATKSSHDFGARWGQGG